MLISRAWITEVLRDVPIANLEALDDQALAAQLTSLGLEVESMRRVGHELTDVVAVRVSSVEPHPHAERLRVVEVTDGTRTHRIVCGAANVPPPGGVVVLAPVGVTLPGGMEIVAREIRQVASAGMLCSEVELDIGSDGDGIIVLPEATQPGTRLVDLIPGVVDTLIEVSVTPNRPDALGHMGVARDLAVALGGCLVPTPLALPQVPQRQELVELIDVSGCGRYLGLVFEGIHVGPSPLWMRVRLHRLGLRAVSNVVDVTNLAMMLWGQPLHGFDRQRLHGQRVQVRRARPEEQLRLLDGRDLSLGPEDLVIADADRPVALAGVMGGEHSGVESSTHEVLLEAAWFEPGVIRRAAKRHGLATDSSHRFERGVDHGNGLVGACAQAAAWLAQVAGARCVAMSEVQGNLPPARRISLRPQRISDLIGVVIPEADSRRILAGVGVEIDDRDPRGWTCISPTHRPDLEGEVDLIDEILRHWGLDRLPAPTPPAANVAEVGPWTPGRRRVTRLATDALREAGFHEHVSLVFSPPEHLTITQDETPVAQAIRLANPMGTDSSVLRTHLLPGLLGALARNAARHGGPVALFECGRVYRWFADANATGGVVAPHIDPAEERPRAGVLYRGGEAVDLVRRVADARRVGRTLVHALTRLGHRAAVRRAEHPVPWLHPGMQAELTLGDPSRVVGRFGQVHPDVCDRWDLPADQGCAYGELWLELVPEPQVPRMIPLPRFPGTSRDLSLDVALAGPCASDIGDALIRAEAAVAAGLSDADPPRLYGERWGSRGVEVVDDYRGKGVTGGRRALLLRLHYRAFNRSVTDREVQELHVAVVERACDELRRTDPGLSIR